MARTEVYILSSQFLVKKLVVKIDYSTTTDQGYLQFP